MNRAEIIHERCMSMLADLWHAPLAPHSHSAIGTATTGRFEAI
jgi:glutamate decarboxylase